MHHAAGHAARLVLTERDRFSPVNINQKLTLEHQEELVFVIVPMPVEVPLDYPEPDNSVIDRRERLVKPRRMGRRLGGDVDQLEMVKALAVGDLDVSNPAVELRQNRLSLGLDDGDVDVLSREAADRIHRCPASNHDDLDCLPGFDALDRRAEEPVGALEMRPDRSPEMGRVRIGLG